MIALRTDRVCRRCFSVSSPVPILHLLFCRHIRSPYVTSSLNADLGCNDEVRTSGVSSQARSLMRPGGPWSLDLVLLYSYVSQGIQPALSRCHAPSCNCVLPVHGLLCCRFLNARLTSFISSTVCGYEKQSAVPNDEHPRGNLSGQYRTRRLLGVPLLCMPHLGGGNAVRPLHALSPTSAGIRVGVGQHWDSFYCVVHMHTNCTFHPGRMGLGYPLLCQGVTVGNEEHMKFRTCLVTHKL